LAAGRIIAGGGPRDLNAGADARTDWLTRLFDAVHEGVYVGLVSATDRARSPPTRI
jgi:hypothetical protein